MKQVHLLTLLQDNFKTISVSFDINNLNKYVYKAPLAMELAPGDFVIVKTNSGGYRGVEVVAVHSEPQLDLDADFEYKWIVQRIDLEAYNQQLAKEEEFKRMMVEVERVKQREALLQSLHENLPKGSKAWILFDQAMKSIGN